MKFCNNLFSAPIKKSLIARFFLPSSISFFVYLSFQPHHSFFVTSRSLLSAGNCQRDRWIVSIWFNIECLHVHRNCTSSLDPTNDRCSRPSRKIIRSWVEARTLCYRRWKFCLRVPKLWGEAISIFINFSVIRFSISYILPWYHNESLI